MRQVPDFVLRAVLDELDEAHSWLSTFYAEEKKELRERTPIAVAYWIDRAAKSLGEVEVALDRFNIDDEDSDTTPPEAFRFRAPEQEFGESRSDIPPRPDGDLVPPS